jgi:NAD dependent epimerase/dehydratase family enzyme
MNPLSPRVLLLGGTGFVGRHVCEKLTRLGCSMTVITRRAITSCGFHPEFAACTRA